MRFPFQNIEDTPQVLVLLGGDPALRVGWRRDLIQKFLKTPMAEMNFSRFDLTENTCAEAIGACRDYPCFGDRRMVVVGNISKIKKKETKFLIDYLKDPSPSTHLILESEKLDGRLDWTKALKKHARILEVPTLGEPEARKYLQECFSKSKKRSAPGVIDAILECMGNSVALLEQAAEQVCLFVGEKEAVELVDVQQLLVKVSEENVFEILDDLFDENILGLHRNLNRLLNSGEAPLRILALLHRHLNILLGIRFSKGEGVSSTFGVPPFFLKKYQAQVRQHGTKMHYGLLQPITEADWKLKSSPVPPNLVFKKCIENIMGMLA